MQCNYCGENGHLVNTNVYSGGIRISCPNSEHYGREFDSFKDFNARRRKQGSARVRLQSVGFKQPESVIRALWDIDEPFQLNNGTDYELTPYGESLFEWYPDVVNYGPQFHAFWNIMADYDTYIPPEQAASRVDHQREFIDVLCNTEVMEACIERLQKKGKMSEDDDEVRDELWNIWFKWQEQRPDTCAFRHVFAGIHPKNHKKTVGLHYWLEYMRLEQRGDIEYIEWHGSQELATSEDPPLATVTYDWDGDKKPKGSTLLGTTPAFEFALYTYLFLQDENTEWSEYILELDDLDIKLVMRRETLWDDGQLVNGILTAYPEEL